MVMNFVFEAIYQAIFSFWKNSKAFKAKNLLIFLMLLSFFLTSCTPTTSNAPRVKVEELNRPSSFYPHQTGLTWQYLPDGDSLDSDRATKRIQGPKVIGGKHYIATHLLGHGLDITSYRKYQDNGVFLAREEGPGYVLSLDPPIKEWPAQGELRVGAIWRGESKTTVRFTDAPASKNTVNFTTEYTYTVVDRRVVRLNVGEFNVYVVNLESRKLSEENELQETLHSEIWFAPFVGEIRNQLDFVLVGGNFSKK